MVGNGPGRKLARSLIALSRRLPKHGIDFDFRKDTWPAGAYVRLREVVPKGENAGKAYGSFFWPREGPPADPDAVTDSHEISGAGSPGWQVVDPQGRLWKELDWPRIMRESRAARQGGGGGGDAGDGQQE
ncbi:unnamed protein product [Pedinophyceae sp. YPF-701]|nr:unnamed protein product [Pedinophyceae sp. YPF-701]